MSANQSKKSLNMPNGEHVEELTLAELVTTDFVKCGHCKDLYTRPVLLPCLHSFCTDCVVDMAISETQNVRKSKTSSKNNNEMRNGLVTENGMKIDGRNGVRAVGNKMEELEQQLRGLTSKEEAKIEFMCPVCWSNLSLVGNTSVFNNGTDETDYNDNGVDTIQDRDVQTVNGQGKKDNKSKITGEKESNSGPMSGVAQRVKIMVRKVVENSLSVNHFLMSVTKVHRYKSDVSRNCQYCLSEGETTLASSLCLDCQDDMCDACANAHRKTRVTRDHTVAPYNSIQQGLYDHDIRSHDFITCNDHPQSVISQFCTECLEPACKACRSRNHYNHEMLSIKEAAAKLLPEVRQIQQGISRRVPLLSEYIRFLKGQVSKLDKTKSLVTSEINFQAELLHKMIEDYRQQTVARLEQACRDEQSNIQQKINKIGTAEKSLEETSSFLLHLGNVGRHEEVLSLYAAVMGRHNQLVHSKPDALTTRLTSIFTAGPSTEQNVKILVGMLDLEKIPVDKEDAPQARLSISTLMPVVIRPPEVKQVFKADAPSDTSTIYPSGLALNKSMIAVVDRENARVKIFDHAGKLLKDFGGDGENKLVKPFDAVFLDNGALAVTDSMAGCVRVFDWTGKYLTNFEGDIRHPRGITVNHKGEVIVVDGHLRHLTVHEGSTGKMIKRIRPYDADSEKDDDNSSLKSMVVIDPFYVAMTTENNIAITDIASPNIKIINHEGLVLATSMNYGIRQDESLHPSGVCVDKFGQMVVADTNNSRIHLGLPTGQMPSLLVTENDGISKPVGLAINNEGFLIVAQSGGEIRVLKYL